MSERLNCTELAKTLKKAPNYVTAMRRAGYVFRYEALMQTTEQHALDCLEAHPEFNASEYLIKGWKRRPKCLAAKPSPSA
jgi:hypothetical protein